MAKARTLIHPGPVAAERIATVPCVASHRQVTLKAGSTLLQAMVDAVGEIGAWFDLDDIRVETLAFVRPAPAPDDGHVAWYSAQTVLTDAIILKGGAHLGRREGAAFAHIHGLWSESDGTRHAGHLLAEATVLSADHLVNVWVLDGAILETAQDAETRFPLFRPVATGTVENRNAVLATIRPNMQLDQALIIIAEVAGLQVKVIKGLGSLVGAYLEGQSAIVDNATEVLLTSDAGLGAIAVGFNGPAISGNLAPSLNRVCVTFEVLLLSNPA
jgi:predicted DNA-binding protein with PD1-like motif